ncbi:unnamed protein product [Adineta ricciae]|uniref:VWFA domain-containing protein n=1 Tax=Adineta ricciae TaxID=249248 RepID=A0A813R807_ADIRI|nr:unnamed protein product [Adineta ricciae]CAF1038059.1 unnamed protein product [Adineta ricciae]
MNPEPSAPPPPYESVTNVNRQNPGQERMPNFDQFINRYEINPSFAERLYKLKGYEIVFICDDSGSMSAPIGDASNPYERQRTRWDELKQTVSIVVDLASILDSDGVDVYFLNREPMLNVRNSSDLEFIFAMEPEGATPIVPVLRQVLKDKRNQVYERNLLILLATDGIPTDERERTDIQTLEHVLRNERQPIDRIPVTIIVCTADDDQSMAYLNDWDKRIPNLDVVDDYRSERQQIQACRGKNTPFSFGDYIVKILLGSIDSWFDNWDETNR